MDEHARYVLQTAEAAKARQSWTVARLAYEVLLGQQPHSSTAWADYGHVLVAGGNPQAGLEALQRARSMKDGVAGVEFGIARALDLLGQPDAALPFLLRAIELDPTLAEARRMLHRLRRKALLKRPDLPLQLRYVIIGTTSICNASCVHCPTGKDSTGHVPRLPMPMPLYRKLLDGIDALGLPITSQISFGLFGDSLADPLVVQRAAYARALFPDVEIVVNTNGAAFNPARHAALLESGVFISLHCESLVAETYDHLMQPLRLERVLPKYLQIFSAFPGRVNVSVPVSRLNRDELPAMRDWFEAQGARSVTFDPISSRCVDDRGVFEDLALNPVRIRCPPDVLEDLIVDADGTVLICCQDFQRVEGIGDLASQEVDELLGGLHRRRVRNRLEAGQHDRISTCAKCYGDLRMAAAP